MSKRRRAGLATLVVILILSTVLYLRSNRFTANSDPVSYAVSLEENPDHATVETHFTLEDTLLYLTHEGPNPKAYAPFIRNLQVRDESGNLLTVTPCTAWQISRCNLFNGWERGQKWLVEASAGTPVVVTYDVALEYDPAEWPAGLDSAAFRGDWGVFFTGRALFLMNGRIRSPFVSANLAWMEGTLVPSEDSRQAISVTFELPESWQASTPWKVTAENSFVADDLVALSESMLMLGTHDTVQTWAGGTTFTLALGGEDVTNEGETLQRAFGEVHAYYTDVLGGPPKTARENPLERAIVVVNSGDVSDGEVIGNDLSVTFTEGQPLFEVVKLETHNDQLILPVQIVFHEFFHLWNGTTFASQPDAEWFKEGVTDYYALRAARQLGYLDRVTMLTLVGDQYRRYVEARASSDLSLTEAGKDEFGNHELLYPGGLLTGLCLDLILRSETGNDKGLDDLMKRVYNDFSASGKALGTAAVQALGEEISGSDLANFFETYVEGSNTVPLAECIALAGLDATSEKGHFRISEAETSSSLVEDIRLSVF